MAKKRRLNKKRRTQLKVREFLGNSTPADLSAAMGLKFYNQIYAYIKVDANPTLAMLEQIADGLTKLRRKKIRIVDLIQE